MCSVESVWEISDNLQNAKKDTKDRKENGEGEYSLNFTDCSTYY